MLRDANAVPPLATLRADVCVVGGGAAGITVARDLRESGLTVVVLESGGLEHDGATQSLYEGTAGGDADVGLTACRERAFGGSTARWAGWCRPLDADDFEGRDWIPMSAWPSALRRDALARFYRRAQQTLQLGAFWYDAETLVAAVGGRTLPLRPERVGTVFYQFSRPPTRFGQAYREDLARARDIEVYLWANLKEIVLAPTGGVVARVECSTLGGNRFAVEADRYVLAMGGIENARMLLASNRQEPAGVGNRAGHVGRFFMEHPHFYGGAVVALRRRAPKVFRRPVEIMTMDDRLGDLPAVVGAALALPSAVRRREGLVNLAITLAPIDRQEAGELTGWSRRRIAALLDSDTAHFSKVDIRCEQRPLASSRVTLTEDRDALGTPRVAVDWRIGEADRADFYRSMELIGAEIGWSRIGRLWMARDDSGLGLAASVLPGCHHMGTTRMSDTPSDGVVDANCRVHGVANLYVAGSSVFRTAGYANPTLTIVALAHRLAGHLVATRARPIEVDVVTRPEAS